MPLPEDRYFDWQPLLLRLEDLLLQGTSGMPFPEELRRAAESLGYRLSDDDTQAALEAAALFVPLAETALPPRQAAVDEGNGPTDARSWSGAQLHALRQASGHAPKWWVPELAGLLRRVGSPFPAPALPAAFALIEEEPELFPNLLPLMDREARKESNRHPGQRWIFPEVPPDLRSGIPKPLALLHALLTEPERMTAWLAVEGAALPAASVGALIKDAGHRLPVAALPWLQGYREHLPAEVQPALLSALTRLGDEELRAKVAATLAALVRFDGDRLVADLPPPGARWGGLLPERGGATRQDLLLSLWAAWNPADMTAHLGRSAAEVAEAAFRSPQSDLLARALFEQWRHFPEPKACLAWLEGRMRHPEVQCGEQEHLLARHLPHETLSQAVSRHIHAERYRLDADGPATRLLAGGSLFWTEALTRDVIDALQARPALAAEMVQRRDLLDAFLWRGHLGTWYRMSQAARPFGDLPPVLQRRTEELRPVIDRRATLHRAFRKTD